MVEFQAVIMAAGGGGQMSDLTSSIPKALLPVGNKPLIWYPVNMLERVGFKDVIIITLSSTVAAIRQIMFSFKTISADVVGISEEDDWGTTDSLYHIKDKVKADLIVLACDILTDFRLHRLADVHRLHDTSVTMLLAPARPDIENIPGVKAKKKQRKHREIIGLSDKKSPQSRVVFLENEADIEDEVMTFSRTLFKQQPNIHVRTDLSDVHVYIVKKWLLEYIAHNRSRSSFHGELLPHLVKKQWKRPRNKVQEESENSNSLSDGRHVNDPKDIFSYLQRNDEKETVLNLSLRTKLQNGRTSSFRPGRGEQDILSVYAYTYEEGLCMRVNSISAFVEANRLMAKNFATIAPNLSSVPLVHPTVMLLEKSQIGSDSMVAEETTIGTKVSVKRSIVGKRCVFGDNVKIINCIVLDKVTIADKCTIQGSVICEEVRIGEGSNVKDSLIGSKRVFEANTDIRSSSLVESSAMMEFD